MRATRRHLYCFLIASVVAAVTIGASSCRARLPARPVRLDDGAVAVLETVTYGKVHRVVRGGAWVKLLLAALPREIGSRFNNRNGFPYSAATVVSAAPSSLIFWFRPQQPAVSPAPGRSVTHVMTTFDERGNEDWEVHYVTHHTGGVGLIGWEMETFPRRGKTVGLRLYRLEDTPHPRWVREWELVVPNPARASYPTWRASALPITRQAGPLAVTLTRFTTRASVTSSTQRVPDGEIPQTYAEFRFHENGRPADWRVFGVTLSDACGNTWKPAMFFDDGKLKLAGALWGDEAAWKVRVEMARAVATDAAPGTLLMVRNIPVPRPQYAEAWERTVKQAGVALHLQVTAGTRQPSSSFSPLLKVRVTPPSESLRLTLVRMWNERGGEYEEGNTPDAQDGRFEFTLPTDARSVDLGFALRRIQVVEFVAKPQRL